MPQSFPIIVVCIDANNNSKVLIRAASRRAKKLGVNWVALYVETSAHFTQDAQYREQVLQYGTMATNSGGQFVEVANDSVADGILSFIAQSSERGHPVIELVMGQRIKEGWLPELRLSLAETLEKQIVKPTRLLKVRLSEQAYKTSWLSAFQLNALSLKSIMWGQLWVALTAIMLLMSGALFPDPDSPMHTRLVEVAFLIVNILCGLRLGLLPSLMTVLSALVVFNMGFLPPLLSLDIAAENDRWAHTAYALTGLVLAMIASYFHSRLEMMTVRIGRNEALYQIGRLSGLVDSRSDAVAMIHQELTSLLGGQVALFLPSTMQQEELTLIYPVETKLDDVDIEALNICWEQLKTSGVGSLTGQRSNWRFEPMLTNESEIGVLAIRITEEIRLDASFGRLLNAVADQCAALLERIDFTRMMSESRVREEREKLRAMLLSSVSHDLKTPLASIIGSLSVYQRMRKSGRLTEDTAQELAVTALEEAQRLDSFITNILDMTRIESGDIHFNRTWVNVDVPVKTVLSRLRQRLQYHHIKVVNEADGIEIYADPMLTEQVLQNVIDNAVKYSPNQTQITVRLRIEHDQFVFEIEDQGEGIPEDKREAIFDKYERLRHQDSHIAGTGLGLAIARAVMEKQDGWVQAQNVDAGGALFTLSFNTYRSNTES
jgi:two-component system sensor histidine kinase KdpD